MDHIGLAETFRKIRENTGLTQEEFSAMYGISQPTVSRCEREGSANSETVFKYMLIDDKKEFDVYMKKRRERALNGSEES